MRLVHLSDLHLGFRQFEGRVTAHGVNRREADVEQTFHAAVDRILALQPDLVIIGGDIFHVVRPSNHAITAALLEFERLVRGLAKPRIIMVAGNHDAPRSRDTGGILGAFALLGIHVVDRGAARITFDDLGCSVLAVPDLPGLVRPPLEPDPAARFNVLLLHGEVQGMLTGAAAADRAAVEITADELRATEFDYVGLGHWHVYREIAPNTFYSGSIDYTSSNPWGELVEEAAREIEGKGIVERDLFSGRQTFHPLPRSRVLLDLPSIDGAQRSPAELDAAIAAAVEASPGGIDDKIVRLVITDVASTVWRGLNHAALKELNRRALSFRVVPRAPAPVTEIGRTGANRVRGTLEQRIRAFLNEQTWPSDIAPADICAAAEQYLQQTLPERADDDALAKALQRSLGQTIDSVDAAPSSRALQEVA